VAPKTRLIKGTSAVIVPAFTAIDPTTAGRPSSSLEPSTLCQPSPLSGVACQLIRDLKKRQLELRQRGILAVGEVIDTGGVESD